VRVPAGVRPRSRGAHGCAERFRELLDPPEAPIFEIADLGIVGDLFTVVPQLLDEVGKRKQL
jgi:hypothetical protein